MTSRGERVGCADLLARVRLVRPKLHVFGHIHESAGTTADGGTLFVNAAAYTTRLGIVAEWGDAGLRVVDEFA